MDGIRIGLLLLVIAIALNFVRIYRNERNEAWRENKKLKRELEELKTEKKKRW